MRHKKIAKLPKRRHNLEVYYTYPKIDLILIFYCPFCQNVIAIEVMHAPAMKELMLSTLNAWIDTVKF